MTRICVFCMLVVFAPSLRGQTPVRAEIRVPDQYLQNQNEWKAFVHVDLFDASNQLIQSTSQYYYTWEIKVNNGPWMGLAEGYGHAYHEPDGHWYETTTLKVLVDIGTEILQVSEKLGISLEPLGLSFHPKKHDGSDFLNYSLQLQHWTGTRWDLHQLLRFA